MAKNSNTSTTKAGSGRLEIQKIHISKIHPNPDNPRVIRDAKFKALQKSIETFPEMLEIRPIVVDEGMMVLGGNMRLAACKALKKDYVFIVKAENLTSDQKREFVIKDNASFGEWEWDVLANEWDADELSEWGLDMPNKREVDEKDLFDIELPFYEPSELKPVINELADIDKTKELIGKIERLKVDNKLKEILKIRASFFTDFNFQKIADFYYKEREEVKEVFKDLGLVILAPKEAVEKGFISLQEEVFDL